MMDVREKLVEQLREVASKTPPICRYDNPDEIEHFGKTITVYCKPFEQFQELMRDAADYIAHGVTVQEWISQTELPWMGEEIAKLCIRYMEDYADFHGYASSQKVKAHIVRLLELEKGGRIAILPQPPKGE